MEKIAFVVHEFGMFKGRGGIASYIYYLCKGLIDYKNCYEIHVLTPVYDEQCALLRLKNFFLHEITEKAIDLQGKMVSRILKKIQPAWVETSDYGGLCLEAILERNRGCPQLEHTTFYVIHHTATRECYEWSYRLPLKIASAQLKYVHYREKASYYLCDLNVFPSLFLAGYIKNLYGIKDYRILRYTYEQEKKSAKDFRTHAALYYDLEGMDEKFVVSYISRIEGRKNQKYLIDSFLRFRKKTGTDAVLVIAGNSVINEVYRYDELENIYQQIPEQYRSDIMFYDFLQAETYQLICSVSNVAVMASAFENFPIAMMEYVSMGIPVMASKYSGCRDYMGAYEHLTAFDPFSDTDLAEKLMAFSKLDTQQQQKVAEVQSASLHQMCCPKNSLEQKLTCYRQIREACIREKKGARYQKGSSYQNCYFIDESSMGGCVPDDWKHGRMDVCLTGHLSKSACKKFLERNKELAERLPAESVLMWGQYPFCTGIWDALNTGAAVYLTGVKLYETNYVNMAQVIADNIWKRMDKFVYVTAGKKEHETDSYVLITNWLFKRCNEIRPEDRLL